MKNEYDFTNAERGKFYRPDAVLNLPVYLEAEVQTYLAERARTRGIDLESLVNDILKKDIALAEVLK